jgi:hypothetical protein
MYNSSLPNLRLVRNDDVERRAAAAVLRALAADLEANPAPSWRARLVAATTVLLDGAEAEVDLEELRYVRDILRIPARNLPVLER